MSPREGSALVIMSSEDRQYLEIAVYLTLIKSVHADLE